MKVSMKKLMHILNILKFAAGGYVPITGPLKVSWEVTYSCNSRCMSCQRWKNPENRNYLSFAEGKGLLAQLADVNVPNISFTGGEPLLRSDIYDLIAYAKALNMTTSLSSNSLTLNEKNVKRICGSGLDILYLSLDGGSPEIHDALRGVQGSFEKTINAIQLIHASKEKSKPSIFVNITVNKKNAADLITIVKKCDDLDIDGITIQPVHDFADLQLAIDDDLRLNATDIQVMNDQIEVLSKDYGRFFPMVREYLDNFETYVRNPEELYKYRCVAAYLTVEINPYGEVFPCPAEFESMGNLRKNSFKEIWYSKHSNNLRKKIKHGDHPICWFDCVAPLNIYMSYINVLKFYKIFNRKLLKYIMIKIK
jgi:MoaA/NifB/PqqE/SkfB family radical SAM enzyme